MIYGFYLAKSFNSSKKSKILKNFHQIMKIFQNFKNFQKFLEILKILKLNYNKCEEWWTLKQSTQILPQNELPHFFE